MIEDLHFDGSVTESVTECVTESVTENLLIEKASQSRRNVVFQKKKKSMEKATI